MAVGFVFGPSLGITDKRWRMGSRIAAFVPGIVAYVALRPASFAKTEPYQLSTSQIIGLLSALTVSFFYARYWERARKSPRVAMSLGDMATIREMKGEEPDDYDDEEDPVTEADLQDAPRGKAR
jgi:phosphatidylglycerol:prolipoprotein diacylglycerol transferase